MTPLTTLPNAFFSGDSLLWTKSFPDFPASAGWVVTWYFSGPAPFNVVAAASGDAHAATLSAAASAALTAGDYTYVARAVLSGAKYTAETGSIRVVRDPASSSAPAAFTAWQNALISYRALAAKKVSNASLNGQTYTFKTLGEMLAAVRALEAEWKREQKQDAAALGHGTNSGNMAVMFRTV